MLPRCFTVNKVAFIWVDLRHHEEGENITENVRDNITLLHKWLDFVHGVESWRNLLAVQHASIIFSLLLQEMRREKGLNDMVSCASRLM